MSVGSRFARATLTVALILVGATGLVVVGAALAPAAGFTVVRLETGSMTPVYPRDSLLLVRDVAADDLVPGDVVTVTRAGRAPVTHRVIGVDDAGDGVRLELQGDANATPDPEPYLVDRAGLVLGGIPFGGQAVDLARSTPGVVGLSLLASALVVWAWWPRRPVPAHRMEVGP